MLSSTSAAAPPSTLPVLGSEFLSTMRCPASTSKLCGGRKSKGVAANWGERKRLINIVRRKSVRISVRAHCTREPRRRAKTGITIGVDCAIDYLLQAP